jgi:hypothetical protein
MAYTATKYLSVRPFPFPRGNDNTQRRAVINGNLVDCDTATEYTPGGIGSSSFEVTAFSATGLVTYAALKGVPLSNGQRVVIYNTAGNTNDGTYIVSQITPSSASAGTFVAVPLPGNVLSGTAQAGQTAEGVGQIQWGNRTLIPQTFVATAVAFSGGVMTVTYTTLTGPQLWPGDKVILAGMTNPGNNGQFGLATVTPTSSTAGSFTVLNPGGVATDSGTGTGNFQPGSDNASVTNEVPIEVVLFSFKGYTYVWDTTNYTIRVFLTGTAAGDPANEAAIGATVAFDPTITFRAEFPRTIAA